MLFVKCKEHISPLLFRCLFENRNSIKNTSVTRRLRWLSGIPSIFLQLLKNFTSLLSTFIVEDNFFLNWAVYFRALHAIPYLDGVIFTETWKQHFKAYVMHLSFKQSFRHNIKGFTEYTFSPNFVKISSASTNTITQMRTNTNDDAQNVTWVKSPAYRMVSF